MGPRGPSTALTDFVRCVKRVALDGIVGGRQDAPESGGKVDNTSRAGLIGSITIGAIGLWAVLQAALAVATVMLGIGGGDTVLDLVNQLALTGLVGFLICGVLFFVWSYQAMSVAHQLFPSLTISPAGSIGWYFVPIASLWMPYRAMSDIWKGSARGAETPRATALLVSWWVLWLGRTILSWVERLTVQSAPDVSAILLLLACAAGIAGAVLLMIIIHRINTMQARRFDASIFDLSLIHI